MICRLTLTYSKIKKLPDVKNFDVDLQVPECEILESV